MHVAVTLTELSLLVIAGLASGTYAKSEGADSLLAAIVGVAAAVAIYLLTK